ncbi:MAG: GTPase Era [Clostridia bacterium]|jgi:GTP-binding protein Era|nr:GTPase Era [Clostridia bacterium]
MVSGFIAILGKPNVGKSSLMNALVGEKVSIVTPKAQTTRDKILGILTDADSQMVFVDTPGIHAPQSKLDDYMSKCVSSATDDVDAVVIVLDATKKLTDSEITFIEKHLRRPSPVYVVINKTDLVSYEKIYPMLSKLAYLTREDGKRGAIKEIIPTSCRTGENVELLKRYLKGELVEGNCYFDPDEITDKSERYMICEIVREKALLFLQDEIPHGIGVYIQTMVYDGGLANIDVDIICEKESHKAIIIGEKGSKLKTIGSRARADIEKLLGTKVYLKLFVKVRDDWRNKGNVLRDIGYDK